MLDRYREYLEEAPEEVFEWEDPEGTGATGWLVINSLRGGAAGGGTRMRPGVTREEVTYLAKAMELKFAFSGPPIGGGKSGIAFDPSDPRKREVLARWFYAIEPLLRSRYGTAGDVAVDETREVIPLCQAMGIAHPQLGILRGHLGLDEAGAETALARVREGVRAPVRTPELAVEGGDFCVSDLVTGYGTAQAALTLLEARGRRPEETRAIVEGFGNVGGACALYLARAGVRIASIVDHHRAAMPDGGMGAAEVEDLLRRRSAVRHLPEDDPTFRAGEDRLAAYSVEADLFVPAAISATVDGQRLDTLASAGVDTIVCGANHPFREPGFGATEILERADREFAVVADIVGSIGTARAFHHLMDPEARASDTDIFAAVHTTVRSAVAGVIDRAGRSDRGLKSAALELALDRRGQEPPHSHQVETSG